MKRILYVVGFFTMGMLGCFEPPQYSNTPKIRFESASFGRGRAGGNDSLTVKFTFTDGDGNLGLESDGARDREPPYNQKWYFLKEKNPSCEEGGGIPCLKKSFIDVANKDNYITYKLRRTTPGYDTLPPYILPYRCENYEIVNNDTFYIQTNKRHYNVFMDIYTKEAIPGGGSKFVLFDVKTLHNQTDCVLGGFNLRFEVLDKNGDPDPGVPVSGEFVYKYRSSLIFAIFGNKTIKVNLKIVDRDGNYSNIIESNEFAIR